MALEKLIPPGDDLYPRSRQRVDGVELGLIRGRSGKHLLLSSSVEGFTGRRLSGGGILCPLTWENALALTKLLPRLAPRCAPESAPVFGFGDRLGLATPGHVLALEGAEVFPMLAQQSVRENARTGRSFADVLARAIFGILQVGYRGAFGADADHLKSIEDAAEAVRTGYTFYTCDPSDHVVNTSGLSAEELADRFRGMPDSVQLRARYLGKEHLVPGLGALRFTEDSLAEAAVKYGNAVRYAGKFYNWLSSLRSGHFDFELSVDETAKSTSLCEHYFIVSELQELGVRLSSLAPRFPGAMEKGVDWRGDLDSFRDELAGHAAIAESFGGYRIGLHSGSDKFSLYPLFAEGIAGNWHVKTAGTSYLVALEVLARVAPGLFRKVLQRSVSQFEQERSTYHLSVDLNRMPDIHRLSDEELAVLLTQDESRQVLHVGFGEVLRSPLGAELLGLLGESEHFHNEALRRHLARHLQGLGVKGRA